VLLNSGSVVGPYEILSPLGAGEMGDVWKARDTRLNRIVAIKTLKGPHTGRFEQEARAIAALNHPNVCTLYDIGPDYLVMEYIDGLPLRGPMPVDDAVRLAGQIASALESAHQRGVLHRDLKPANVLVAGGSVKLLDFGIATLRVGVDQEATRTIEGTVLGTVAYMSPEQAVGKRVDERSDIFSLGSVLYELISGERAFRGDSTAEVLSAILRDEPQALAAPDAIARIVTRCLRKAPSERFQRMHDVCAALGHYAEPAKDQPPSIAVLPFADMSPGKDQDYFSDGLAEEIINALAQVPGLKVIARTSAFAFKGQNTDIRRIAEMLGVAHVLEGSVRKSGDRIRVAAQLITAADGSHLWSERYDRQLADVFAVQDEIAGAITKALSTRLTIGAGTERQHTPTLEAYEAYLKGRHRLWTITPESLQESRDYFRQAIAADPKFAPAYTGLSHHYLSLAMFSLMSAHQAMPQMRANAERALELDPSLPDGHALLGVVAALYEYDWAESAREFGIARAREPVPPWVRNVYSLFYLMYRGRAEDALLEMQQALSDDPLAVNLRYTTGVCLAGAGRLLEAEAQFKRVLELDPAFMTAYELQAFVHLARGDVAKACSWAEQAAKLAPWDPVVIGTHAATLKLAGDTATARALIETLGDGSAYGAPIGLAVHYLLLREVDQAADWIVRAAEQRYPGILFFVYLIGQPLRDSPRWPALAKMMNLPQSEPRNGNS
jgi:TolB-like protein/Tfp pilus assembly protein PilF/predicted Ser/Thr protein kinase